MRRSTFVSMGAAAALVVAGLSLTPAIGQAPKSGGVLNIMAREDLAQGFATHETATVATSTPSLPCFSNLVFFDPAKKTESMDTVVGELAEKWSWQDNYKNLVFFLRRDVKWHDGKPFTSKDVKYTFDLVREAPEATAKLRINPRKDWYANVEHIEAPDPYTVVFRLKRPQPSLLLMLASGYSPIYAAHVPARQLPHHLRGDGPVQGQGVAQGRVHRVREEPRLLHQGPAVPRRAQVRDHRGARNADRRAAVRPARRGLPR
jgi:peptide/nickel transport system substrate-binding protein